LDIQVLAALFNIADPLPEVYTRKYLGVQEEENESLSSLWQIEIDAPFNRGQFL
jgi:hypothetical protein